MLNGLYETVGSADRDALARGYIFTEEEIKKWLGDMTRVSPGPNYVLVITSGLSPRLYYQNCWYVCYEWEKRAVRMHDGETNVDPVPGKLVVVDDDTLVVNTDMKFFSFPSLKILRERIAIQREEERLALLKHGRFAY